MWLIRQQDAPLYTYLIKVTKSKKSQILNVIKNHGQMSNEINLELHNFYPLKQYD